MRKTLIIIIALLLCFCLGFGACLIAQKLFFREQTQTPETVYSRIPSADQLDTMLGVTLPKVNPIVSVQMDKTALFVLQFNEEDWNQVITLLTAKEGSMPIENGLLTQLHEDAFDLINAQVQLSTNVEYWPSVIEGYSLLLTSSGEAMGEMQLPDPFVGIFVLLNSENRQLCVYSLS